MSPWIERILKEFPADLSRLWIAADPDDVLLDEQVLSGLRERGFEVLPFEDSVAFRESGALINLTDVPYDLVVPVR